jgi:hypothetical protein
MSERKSDGQRASAVAIAAGMATPPDQEKCQGICFVTHTQQRTQLHFTGSQGRSTGVPVVLVGAVFFYSSE